MADANRQVGVSEVAFYRWRKEYGGMKADQLKCLREIERLRRAISDLTLDKLIWRRPSRETSEPLSPAPLH
jgi:putative transposase